MMPKNALDVIDRKIIDCLQSDGRMSNQELSERVGLSPSPCLRRVKQLEASGLISGYVALLDRRKASLDLLAYVEVQVDRHSETAAEAFKEAVLREPLVVGCYAMTGGYDYLLRVVVPDIAGYDAVYKKLIRSAELFDVSSSFAMEQLKYTTALPLHFMPGAATTASPGSTSNTSSKRASKRASTRSSCAQQRLEFSVHTKSKNRVFTTVNGPAGKPYI